MPAQNGSRQPVRLDARLERHGLWPHFHSQFVVTLSFELAKALEPRYVVVTDERVYVTSTPDPPITTFRPDVSTTLPKQPGAELETLRWSTGLALADPMVVRVPQPERIRERFVTVRTLEGEVVTVVEVLSPNNKAPGHEGRAAYLKKREQVLLSTSHLVEMDLVSGGERMPLEEPWPACAYAILVSRADRRPQAELYPVPEGAALPTIRFPLRAPDPDFPLDLQRVLETVWEQGRYEHLLAHLPRMEAEDAEPS